MNRWRRARLLSGLLLVAACSRPLPEQDSPGAVAYVRECGLCHPAHHPAALTAAMWRYQVARMAEMRARRGLPPIASADEKLILEYLTSHAG